MQKVRQPVITIAIPAYNAAKTIEETLKSALEQKTPGCDREILVIDDGSKDNTVEIVKKYPVRLLLNEVNCGIGITLARLMHEALGDYVIYLCSDDQFVDPFVVNDYVQQFLANKSLGIIGRYFYQYMQGYPGAIMVSRDRNILTQSCCPSGIAFKKDEVVGSNKIFIECPTMVKQYLLKGYTWTMIEYDTVRARIFPGENTGNKESYYKGSMYQNWREFLGHPLVFYQGYVQIKNRAPRKLWEEVKQSLIDNKRALLHPLFWFYLFMAVVFSGKILRPLSNFYRHRITRRFVRIIPRGGNT